MKVPQSELYVHCEGGLTKKELQWLGDRVEPLLVEIVSTYPQSDLAHLDELEISLVDDETLANVHADFLDDPSQTDVITFPHVEILISVEMAAQRAGQFGKDQLGETVLYLVHGLLHLAGFDDRSDEDFQKMATEQERIWTKLGVR